MIQYFPIVTGSLTVLGNINVSGSITTSGSITISGSITSASFASTASYWSGSIVNAESASFVANAQTASYVLNAVSSSFASTASYWSGSIINAESASFVANAQTASYVLNAVSSSFASTASFVALAQSASNAVSAVTASFANNLTVAGTLTAQTLVVQTITSSVDFVTGSTRFGSIAANTHQFTGSVGVEGTGIFYQPLTNSTSYLTVKNNRARNAAVYTETTNGGFYAGTSIGTDTFNYQIYDGVAGSARLTISSTGAATFSSSVTAGAFIKSSVTSGGSVITAESTATNGEAQIELLGKNSSGTIRSGTFKYDNSDVIRIGTSSNIGMRFETNDVTRLTIASSGAATFASSVTANSIVSSTTITSTGAISSGGGTISSYSGTPANVSNGGNTTFVYQQAGGEFAAGFMYSIIGLYAPSGTNILGVGQGYAYFFADGSTNGTSATAQIASGWSVAASATNAGAFTITFTNNSGATMTSVNYRIIKVNRIGAG